MESPPAAIPELACVKSGGLPNDEGGSATLELICNPESPACAKAGANASAHRKGSMASLPARRTSRAPADTMASLFKVQFGVGLTRLLVPITVVLLSLNL